MNRISVAATALAAAAALLTGCTPIVNSGAGNSGGGAGGPGADGGVGTAGTAGPADPNSPAQPPKSPANGSTRTPGTSNQTPTGPPAGNQTPAGPPPDNRPVIGNIEQSPSNVQCSYVPHGNADGSDGLTVFAYTLLIGASSLPQPITWSVAFSNGYQVTPTGYPNNQATQAFQGPIRSGDWGGRLVVRITADSGDRYRESNEKDNVIVVTVNLPRVRSAQTIDPLSCSAARG